MSIGIPKKEIRSTYIGKDEKADKNKTEKAANKIAILRYPITENMITAQKEEITVAPNSS